jgi:hypothetical protein
LAGIELAIAFVGTGVVRLLAATAIRVVHIGNRAVVPAGFGVIVARVGNQPAQAKPRRNTESPADEQNGQLVPHRMCTDYPINALSANDRARATLIKAVYWAGP